MYCSHLSLTNFRNYMRLELDLSPGITVLLGDNAQGKTNLLEAIYFLATTRSSRAGSDRELIHWLAAAEGITAARVAAEIRRAHGTLRVELGLAAREGSSDGGDPLVPAPIGKRIRVNGIAQRATDYLGRVNVVMFGPQDIDLVAGSPALRRRYLDITSSQVEPRYVRALQQYNRVLQQRNHLLRLIRDHHAGGDQLAFWDDQVVEHGSFLVAYRRRLVAELDGLAQESHRKLTDSVQRLRIQYLASLGEGAQASQRGGDTPSEEELASVAAAFRRELRRLQPREVSAGASLVGPHRDDLQFPLDRVDVGVYGSRGQQRSVALALKLAEAAFLRSRTAEQPILLLDDVFSELDARRRRHVLDSVVLGQQVLVTATDLGHLESDIVSRAELCRIEQGRVEHLAGVSPVIGDK